MSGLGKGVTTSSIAKLLQLADQKVSCVKIDPYLNYDAGTMNPIAHGEVFVTEDGGQIHDGEDVLFLWPPTRCCHDSICKEK